LSRSRVVKLPTSWKWKTMSWTSEALSREEAFFLLTFLTSKCKSSISPSITLSHIAKSMYKLKMLCSGLDLSVCCDAILSSKFAVRRERASECDFPLDVLRENGYFFLQHLLSSPSLVQWVQGCWLRRKLRWHAPSWTPRRTHRLL